MYHSLIQRLHKEWVVYEELIKLVGGRNKINNFLITVGNEYPIAEEKKEFIKTNGKKAKQKKTFFKIITKEDFINEF